MKKTHGKSNSRTYRIWVHMRRRCSNPEHPSYANYGARGITVCERWLKFENFLDDMGECPANTSIDRIDNLKGYSPENCRWASHEDQNNNRRSNVFLTHKGKTLTVRQWSREIGVHHATLHTRIDKGWSVDEILSPPKFQKGKKRPKRSKDRKKILIDGELISIRAAARKAGLNYLTVYCRLRAGYSVEEALSPISHKTGKPL